MKTLKKSILPIVFATAWIGFSEFLRNELLFKSYWIEHYRSMGLVFPSEMLNNAVWGIWSLVFATAIYLISRKFSLRQTTFLGWLTGFVMMWLVVGNMGVLPFELLYYAVPMSLIEVFVASWIIFAFDKKRQTS